MCKLKILFFAADPMGTDKLQLGKDMQKIQQRVHSAKHGNALEFHWRLAARPEDLLQALKEIRPHVVHFSGHGQEDGIYLLDPDGGPRLIDAAALTRLFELFPGKIRLVVLNSCLSLRQARPIAGVVGCAIGTQGKIADEAAIAFGVALYEAIACGKSVQRSFDEAVNVLQLEHRADKDYPQLVAKPGVKPSRLFLLRRRLCQLGRAAFGLTLVIAATIAVKIAWPPSVQPNCGWGVGPPPHTPVDGSRAPVAAAVNGMDSDLATAKILYRGGHCAAAFPLFKRAAEAGVPEAMSFLGISYLEGQGTKPDTILALVWLRKAASNNKRDPRGMTALGSAYQNGDGVTRSLYLARHWYLAAATEKGWAEAMRSLGTLYRDEGSYDSALVWYAKAAHAGSQDAWIDAGLIYESGSGPNHDLGRARRLYRMAADSGSPRGMFAMGRVHQEAIGVPQDYRLARAWYLRAARLGSPEAMNAIGDLYLHGLGVPQSHAKAIHWYKRARKAGSRLAADELDSLKAN